VFKRIAEAALRHLGIAPTIDAPPPVLVAARASEAEPLATRPISVPVRTANVEAVLEPARAGLMPDLRGLSAREAIRALTSVGMTARLSGQGFVLEQSPAPGSLLIPGDTCALKLSRKPPSVPAGAPQ
jgi:cell division protein FtsI (penicillin-binding protein 3)